MENSKKKTNPIAIITTNEFQFIRYVSENRLWDKKPKQVKVLSDITNVVFEYAVEIEGSENVTDYVIERVQTIN